VCFCLFVVQLKDASRNKMIRLQRSMFSILSVAMSFNIRIVLVKLDLDILKKCEWFVPA